MVPETPAVTASTSPRPDDTWRALRSAGGLASLLLVICGLTLAVSRVWVADGWNPAVIVVMHTTAHNTSKGTRIRDMRSTSM